ncbi:hypothetical protein SCHPADRAFT_902308 [Schizopora paradoxa]|uniref:Uncharacterized protein n=1 Tax=Schizopora paradoxa TaxID=27342 RepID=A0A0H2RUL1_9AGAM|nr:hypothetical protein SCHPADRAFT_902308 [Schizopora paradoxa]
MTLSKDVLQSFREYPFDEDAEFQAGLSEILGARTQSGAEAGQTNVGDIIGQAKAYYFSSKCGIPFSWEEYLQQTQDEPHNNLQPSKAATGETDLVSNELSFAQISALIESGETHLIPNNEIIPGGVNIASPSQSKVNSARKPWEKAPEPEQSQ